MFQNYIIKLALSTARFAPHSSRPTTHERKRPLELLTVVCAGLVGTVFGDWLLSLCVPRRAASVHVELLVNSLRHTCIIFPGFSNPKELGQGMIRVLGAGKTILTVNYGTSMDDDAIYAVIMQELKRLGVSGRITLYGHSMGGQVGNRFLQRYQENGSPYGPVTELVLDCSPSTVASLQSPLRPSILRALVRLLWGGPILSLIIAAGNYASRYIMPPVLSPTTDRKLYRRYARGLAWFSPRAWLAQMRYMVSHNPRSFATPTAFYYIGCDNPKRDQLVRQEQSIKDWRELFPALRVLPSAYISHAWPLEQPEAYEHMMRVIWSEVPYSFAE